MPATHTCTGCLSLSLSHTHTCAGCHRTKSKQNFGPEVSHSTHTHTRAQAVYPHTHTHTHVHRLSQNKIQTKLWPRGFPLPTHKHTLSWNKRQNSFGLHVQTPVSPWSHVRFLCCFSLVGCSAPFPPPPWSSLPLSTKPWSQRPVQLAAQSVSSQRPALTAPHPTIQISIPKPACSFLRKCLVQSKHSINICWMNYEC